jgi:splicing factor 1
VYGPDGKRKNTRAVRWRDRYTAERQDLLEKLMSLNPSVRNNSLFRRKRTNRVPIPIEKHPNYNFIGLIIGPRGKTQKELEAKTGCKIAIRGKGSVKEGARGRRDGKVMDGDDEPLHVVITGDDQGSVDAATDMIQQMLVVIDDEKNVHKQAQLRELALLNGTLKEDEYCPICAEKGHRAFECPKRFSTQNNKNKIQIRCAICGDTSHPTRDCTQKVNPELAEGAGMKNKQELDSDYADFMAELDGKKSESVKQEKIPPAITTAATAEQPVGITILKPAVAIPTSHATPTLLPPPPAPPSLLPPPPPPVVPTFAAFPPPIQAGPAASALPLPPPVSVPYGGYMPPQVQGHPPPTTVPTGFSQGYDANAYYSQGGQPQSQHVEQHQYLQTYPQQPPQMQQAPPAVQDETEGWDYQSYYGQQNNGAGGFNWWEQT